jgi:excisionase family DNA binding protein
MGEIDVDLSALQLLTITDVAKLLSVSETTVKRLIYSGELESVKIGRARRIAPEAVAEYKNKLRKRAETR